MMATRPSTSCRQRGRRAKVGSDGGGLNLPITTPSRATLEQRPYPNLGPLLCAHNDPAFDLKDVTRRLE